MANGRRPVSTARKLVAAVLGTLATFIILFGAGMTSWAIAALGVALLVLAISLVLITAFPGAERAWVAGIAHVRSVSEPPASSTYGRCELQILVDAPGVPPRSVKIRDPRVPVAKWPDPGATLPIMVAIDDQRHVRIMWDDVLTHAEAAAQPTELPPEFDEAEFDLVGDGLVTDDDLLDGDDQPPWARPGHDDDDRFADSDDLPVAEAPRRDADDRRPPESRRDPAENPRPDFTRPDFDPDIEAPTPRSAEDRPGDTVVVSQTPGGPIVLEGTLVDPPPVPLPRRPRPTPHGAAGAEQTPTAGSGPTAATDPAGADTRPETTVGTAATGTALADPPAGADLTGDPSPPVDIDIDIDGPDAPPADPDDDPGPIHGVGLTLLVADLDRSVAFYRDMLGFFEIDGGDGNAVLASGQTRLVLRSIPEVAPVNRRLMHLNLEVDDLQRVHDELRSKGVRFTYAPRAVNRGARLELWAAAFRDPDGHGIAIIEWRERQRGSAEDDPTDVPDVRPDGGEHQAHPQQ